MKILFTGGGTAGHIFPIISIVREIRRKYPYGGFEFSYIGPKDKFAKELLLKEDIEVRTVMAGKFRRYFSFKNFIDIFKIPIGVFQAFYHIFVVSPDVIFSKGGYGSIPTSIAGWILLVPIFLHESDITPGLANRLASRFALEIFTAFPVKKTEYFPVEKMISVGNPIRTELLEGSIEKAEKIFNLTEDKPVILVLGGSQGAQEVNNHLLTVLSDLLSNFEIIHQTGKENYEQIKREAGVVVSKEQEKYYHPYPFLTEEELVNAYWAADLIVSRAGSGSIFEIAAVGKPSILLPLPSAAQNHQVKNAYAYASTGAAVVIEDANFRPHFFLEKVKNIFSEGEVMQEMAESAIAFSRPDSARVIAEYLVSYLS